MLGSFLFFAEPIIIFAHTNSILQLRLPERRLGLLGLLVVTSWRLHMYVCVCKNFPTIIFKNDNISPLVRKGDECQVCARLYICLFESSLQKCYEAGVYFTSTLLSCGLLLTQQPEWPCSSQILSLLCLELSRSFLAHLRIEAKVLLWPTNPLIWCLPFTSRTPSLPPFLLLL